MGELRLSARAAVLLALLACACVSVSPQTTPARSEFIILGTQSGPVPSARRAQPANLLRWRDQHILIDCGDGCAGQLAKAGIALGDIDAVFISHVHADHIGGLFGLLAMRYQTMEQGALTIYGPPGAAAMISDWSEAMRPLAASLHRSSPRFDVVELTDGGRVELGEIAVSTARNSHYDLAPSNDAISLSYRFDLPDRAIGYTGDTGPSPRAEILLAGVDLLVCEVIDPDAAIADIRAHRPDASEAVLSMLRQHFTRQHLSPVEAGLLAARAGVGRLVFTHVGMPDAQIAHARAEVASHYRGAITFANDLERY